MQAPAYRAGFFFRCGRERVEERHSHGWHELIVFTEGVYEGRVGRRRFTAGRGDAVLYPRGKRHQEANGPGEPLAFFVLQFDWAALPPELPLRVQDVHGRLRTLLEWLNENWWWYSPYSAQYCHGLLHAVLAEYMHLAIEPSADLVLRVRRHITEHLAEPLQLQDLARAANLSRTHFARRYRQLCGVTPLAEVRRLRLAEAVRLLQGTELPLKEIAARVGLSGACALAHLFRKHLRATPVQVRRGTGRTKVELNQALTATTVLDLRQVRPGLSVP